MLRGALPTCPRRCDPFTLARRCPLPLHARVRAGGHTPRLSPSADACPIAAHGCGFSPTLSACRRAKRATRNRTGGRLQPLLLRTRGHGQRACAAGLWPQTPQLVCGGSCCPPAHNIHRAALDCARWPVDVAAGPTGSGAVGLPPAPSTACHPKDLQSFYTLKCCGRAAALAYGGGDCQRICASKFGRSMLESPLLSSA